MKDISLYLKPYSFDENFKSKHAIGCTIKQFHKLSKNDKIDIAILGVEEERGTNLHSGCGNGANRIRESLYQLNNHFTELSIVDLGNIIAGEKIKDTYFAVSEVISELIKKEITVIILGGSQDITYANYKAYQKLEQMVNLVTIDPSIDINVSDDKITDTNFINHIITHQPNYLFNYSNIGFQSYFVPKDVWELMEKMHFDAYRLGVVRGILTQTEPLVRNADIVSLDISAIRNSDLPGCKLPSPNGFYGEEICQIAKYCGASDKLTSFGVYNYNATYDNNGVGAMLSAQIVWYFLDGFNSREGDYPIASKESYLKYLVHIPKNDETLVFYKSEKTNRWWTDIPYPGEKNRKYHRHLMVPCDYEDYIKATNGEIPEKWWNTFLKLS